MTGPPVPIIGSLDDIHVQAVVGELDRRARTSIVVDAATLGGSSMTASGLSILGFKDWPSSSWTGRGWARRWAPDGWAVGVGVGSREAASAAAWLGLLHAAVNSAPTEWLTASHHLSTAENKLFQYVTAVARGIPAPETVVVPDRGTLNRILAGPVVVKSLGPGHFVDATGTAHVVYTQDLPDDVTDEQLAATPFLIQERLAALEHLRIVTVGGQTWASALDAVDVPLDWRMAESAHGSFVTCTRPEIEAAAARYADALNLGYSSQDWIVTSTGHFVVDVNPSGQWLFLPEPTATSITTALVDWLTGTADD